MVDIHHQLRYSQQFHCSPDKGCCDHIANEESSIVWKEYTPNVRKICERGEDGREEGKEEEEEEEEEEEGGRKRRRRKRREGGRGGREEEEEEEENMSYHSDQLAVHDNYM